jgi:hypothetical protein
MDRSMKKSLNEFLSQTKAMQAAIDFAGNLDEAIKVEASLESNRKEANKLKAVLVTQKGDIAEAEKSLKYAQDRVKESEKQAAQIRTKADLDAGTALGAAQTEAAELVAQAKDRAESIKTGALAAQQAIRDDLVLLDNERSGIRGDVEKLNEALAAQKAQIEDNDKRIAAFTKAAKTL